MLEIWLLKHWYRLPPTISTHNIINQLTSAVPRWHWVCTTKVCMRDFLHCTGIASGNFSMRNKKTNQWWSNWKKNYGREQKKQAELLGNILRCVRERRRITKSPEKVGESPARAVAVGVPVAASAPSLTSSHCAPGEFPGVNPGKQQRRQLEQALKQSWTRLEWSEKW